MIKDSLNIVFLSKSYIKKLKSLNWIAIWKERDLCVISMASSSDPSKPVVERKKKGAPIKFLVPLIYAPALPLIRLSLRHKPVLRDRLFGLVLAGAFAHGFYLVYPLYLLTCVLAFLSHWNLCGLLKLQLLASKVENFVCIASCLVDDLVGKHACLGLGLS